MTRSVGQRVGGWVGDFLACKGKNTFFFFFLGVGRIIIFFRNYVKIKIKQNIFIKKHLGIFFAIFFEIKIIKLATF
jgi:hypothetical protein